MGLWELLLFMYFSFYFATCLRVGNRLRKFVFHIIIVTNINEEKIVPYKIECP